MANAHPLGFRASAGLPSLLTLAASLQLAAPGDAFAGERYWECDNQRWDAACWSADDHGLGGQPAHRDDVYLIQSDGLDRRVLYSNLLYPDAVLDSLTIDATGGGNMSLLQRRDNLRTLQSLIGDQGSATMIQSGGLHSAQTLTLGNAAGSQGHYVVRDLAVVEAGILRVGNSGSGTMNILRGALVETTYGYIAAQAGAQGNVTLRGEGSTWNLADALEIGSQHGAGSAEGALEIRAGSAVNVTNAVSIWNGGSLLLAGGEIAATQIQINGGLVAGSGLISADLRNAGTLHIGSDADAVVIDGDYTQHQTGTLQLTLGSHNADSPASLLQVSGTALISGTLDIALSTSGEGPGAFHPQAGDTFDILTAELISGDFDLINDSIFADGSLVWRVEILADAYGSLDVLRLRVAEVPLPASLWLLGSGLICLLGGARRKRCASGHH